MLRSRYLKSRLLAVLLAVGAAFGVGLSAAPQAGAASLTQITDFGNNPTDLQMYVYVPNSVKAAPSILLALHGCQGSGPYLYSSTDFGALADRYGFIVIYPSTSPGGSCWLRPPHHPGHPGRPRRRRHHRPRPHHRRPAGAHSRPAPPPENTRDSRTPKPRATRHGQESDTEGTLMPTPGEQGLGKVAECAF
ncbi:hypothetical protein [Kitasatospora sp. NPDC056531]|uniref:hypothetical protein n=1 Tax=Kitasatospora sp. NPDC056531 TaxID=3345856 RepID=UPI003697BA0C